MMLLLMLKLVRRLMMQLEAPVKIWRPLHLRQHLLARQMLVHLATEEEKEEEIGAREHVTVVVAGVLLLVLLLQRKEILVAHRPRQLHLHLMVM